MGGLLLLLAAAVALLWANSSAAGSYRALWQLQVGTQLGGLNLQRSLEWIVNDVLMAVFFFAIGLEIRKELHDGQLSEWRRASLPAFAAVGGMLVPALLYLAVAGTPAVRAGWAIPMATDIAFALGVLALLGKRAPASLRVLLLALAVIDDVGAIIVIALFFSSGITTAGVLLAVLGVALILGLRAIGVRAIPAYIVPGVLVWLGVYVAGVHPTIAGVIVGLLTPVLPAAGEARSPVDFLTARLHPWVSFVIMPVFALANAGVSLAGLSLAGGGAAPALAVALGLLVGKPLGVVSLSWLAIRFKAAVLPDGLGARHLVLLGVLAGIGFTMSLFMAQLAFADEALLGAAKLGVLLASGTAAVLGLSLGRALLPLPRPK